MQLISFKRSINELTDVQKFIIECKIINGELGRGLQPPTILIMDIIKYIATKWFRRIKLLRFEFQLVRSNFEFIILFS